MNARTIIGSVGIAGSAVMMVVGTLLSHSWMSALPCVVIVVALVREWLIFICAETDRPLQGVSLPRTAWWNFAGYYVLLVGLLLMWLGPSVFHWSDLVMLGVFVALLVVLAVWMIVRLRKMPELPRWTFANPFQRQRQ